MQNLESFSEFTVGQFVELIPWAHNNGKCYTPVFDLQTNEESLLLSGSILMIVGRGDELLTEENQISKKKLFVNRSYGQLYGFTHDEKKFLFKVVSLSQGLLSYWVHSYDIKKLTNQQ